MGQDRVFGGFGNDSAENLLRSIWCSSAVYQEREFHMLADWNYHQSTQLLTDYIQKCQAEAWKRSHKFECRKWDDAEDSMQPRYRDHIIRAVTELLWRWHKGSISQPEWDDIQDLKSNYDLFAKEIIPGVPAAKQNEFDRKDQVDKFGELTWWHTTFDRMKKSPFTREQVVRLIALVSSIFPQYVDNMCEPRKR